MPSIKCESSFFMRDDAGSAVLCAHSGDSAGDGLPIEIEDLLEMGGSVVGDEFECELLFGEKAIN